MWRRVALAMAAAALAAMSATAGRADSAQVSVGTAAAAPGDVAMVPVTVSPDPATPLGALVVRIGYDAGRVTATSASALASGVVAECNLAAAGEARCGLVHATGMAGYVLVVSFQVLDSAPAGIVPLTLTVEQCFTVDGQGAQCGASNGAVLVQVPSAPPPPPSLVAIHPLDVGRALITWQPPAGVVTFYRLRSALNFEMTFAVNEVDVSASALGGLNLLTVGVPEADGLAFYYQLAACNGTGCSPFVRVGGLARRIWPAASDWNFYMAAYDFMGTTAAAAFNASPVSGKAASMAFYDGVQGFGGEHRGNCSLPVSPAQWCRQVWASANPFASASQVFPPLADPSLPPPPGTEVGVALRVR